MATEHRIKGHRININNWMLAKVDLRVQECMIMRTETGSGLKYSTRL